MAHTPLFTTKFSFDRRTFFFDVKKDSKGEEYLRITQVSILGEKRQRSYMTIRKNEVKDFQEAITDALTFMEAIA